MLKTLKPKLFLSTLIVTGVIAGAAFAPVQAAEFNAKETTAIEGIIKDYLMENPKVIFESIEAFRAQQEKEQREQAQNTIADNIAALTSEDAPSIGPADADITVVEFFDYNCGYCKRALSDVQAAVEVDKKVRFVFKEMPILGPTSMTAAQWAMAAHKQGKYFEYHVALMEHRGPKNEKELSKLAEKLGLDVEQMKKDAGSDETKAMIGEDVTLGRKIGINGTPAFIVGETLYPGYIGKDGLMQSIEEERKKK